MKFIIVDKNSTGIDVYVYSLNVSDCTLKVRNYCSYCPSVLVVLSTSLSSRLVRRFLETVDIHNSLDVRRFFSYELDHCVFSTFSLMNNPFFTRSGKPRKRLLDLL